MLGELDSLVLLRGIVKRFPGVLANDHIDFELRKGEVHALLGENGAGKTTLMNILYGLYKPDEGEIYIKGRRVELKSPKDAINLGIGMVHQNFKLVEPHTVLENIILGLSDLGFKIDFRKHAERIRSLAERYGWRLDPYARVWQLSAGEKQQVELLKILYRGADILILDEPTSVLTPQETRMLFKALRRMAAEGKGIIFITHKLDEVMEVSDRVTVMRKGRVVVTKKTSETTKSELANYMIGRPMIFSAPKSEAKPGKTIIRLIDLEALSDRGTLALKKVSLEVRSGEILGIAGISGNGQIELAEVIVGLRKAINGKIILDGVDITNKNSREILELGIAYIPPEATKWGVLPDMRVVDNLFLKAYRYPPYSNKLLLNWRTMFKKAEDIVREFEIVTPSIFTKARSLSGGNIQRLIIARELSGLIGKIPRLIVAAYPTKGLDIGATEFVHKILLRYKRLRSGIIFISEDLDEILMLSDRIAVISNGRITGVLDRKEANIEKLGLMMSEALA
ncbi:MAG: heme ABC transporter ATP-binding protein [Thaumarchaeota archaeon]|nr:MAG: heme ABC transporter ATP-binding protein [Nitrososphaerota archaeon]